jgi:hypothetical protein
MGLNPLKGHIINNLGLCPSLTDPHPLLIIKIIDQTNLSSKIDSLPRGLLLEEILINS